MGEAPRYTELSNEITLNLSDAGTRGGVKLLRQVDAQLFHGYRTARFIPDATPLRNHLTDLLRVR
jgi:hypothetical protein